MNLFEASVACKMCGMDYGEWHYKCEVLHLIDPPDIEEVHKNMKESSRKTKVCAMCGKIIDDPRGQRKFCSASCKTRHHRKRKAAVNNG